MNASRLLVLPLALSVLTAPFASGCIIVDGGDDDGMSGDSAADADGTGDPSDGSGDANDSDPDETGAPGGADAPGDGTWLYTETGVVANDCEFIEDPTNGWGEFGVAASAGGFTVTPDDGTEPFECTSGSGAFNCPERLVDEMAEGGSSLQVFVTVTGTLPSEDEMSGTQDGTIVCEGDDCALVEQLLATTFPCSFSVGFDASRQ